MGITISYPEADLYYGGIEGTLSGEDAYRFFMTYGYWPNEATRNAGITYMGQNGYAINTAGTFGDPNDPYSGYQVIADNSTPGRTAPTNINGTYFMPMYDPMGNFTYNQVTDAQGNPIQQQQTDWYAEAAAGRPVIGPAVSSDMSVTDYNRLNPNAPTSIQSGSPEEQAVMGQQAPTVFQELSYALPQGQSVPMNQQATQNQAILDVGAGISNLGTQFTQASQYPNAGTISNFWDSGQNSQGSGVQLSPENSDLARWFRETYGSNYGM
jgi:hypothetical protein